MSGTIVAGMNIVNAWREGAIETGTAGFGAGEVVPGILAANCASTMVGTIVAGMDIFNE